jgi:hypothetical protein
MMTTHIIPGKEPIYWISAGKKSNGVTLPGQVTSMNWTDVEQKADVAAFTARLAVLKMDLMDVDLVTQDEK